MSKIKVTENNGFKNIIIPNVHFSTGAYKAYNGQDSQVKRLTVYISVPDEEMRKELAEAGLTIYDNSKTVKNGEPIQYWVIVKFGKDTTLYDLSNMVKQVEQFTPDHVNFEVDNADLALTITKDSNTKQVIKRLSAYKYYPAKVSVFTGDLFGDDSDFATIQSPQEDEKISAPQEGLFQE